MDYDDDSKIGIRKPRRYTGYTPNDDDADDSKLGIVEGYEAIKSKGKKLQLVKTKIARDHQKLYKLISKVSETIQFFVNYQDKNYENTVKLFESAQSALDELIAQVAAKTDPNSPITASKPTATIEIVPETVDDLYSLINSVLRPTFYALVSGFVTGNLDKLNEQDMPKINKILVNSMLTHNIFQTKIIQSIVKQITVISKRVQSYDRQFVNEKNNPLVYIEKSSSIIFSPRMSELQGNNENYFKILRYITEKINENLASAPKKFNNDMNIMIALKVNEILRNLNMKSKRELKKLDFNAIPPNILQNIGYDTILANPTEAKRMTGLSRKTLFDYITNDNAGNSNIFEGLGSGLSKRKWEDVEADLYSPGNIKRAKGPGLSGQKSKSILDELENDSFSPIFSVPQNESKKTPGAKKAAQKPKKGFLNAPDLNKLLGGIDDHEDDAIEAGSLEELKQRLADSYEKIKSMDVSDFDKNSDTVREIYDYIAKITRNIISYYTRLFDDEVDFEEADMEDFLKNLSSEQKDVFNQMQNYAINRDETVRDILVSSPLYAKLFAKIQHSYSVIGILLHALDLLMTKYQSYTAITDMMRSISTNYFGPHTHMSITTFIPKNNLELNYNGYGQFPLNLERFIKDTSVNGYQINLNGFQTLPIEYFLFSAKDKSCCFSSPEEMSKKILTNHLKNIETIAKSMQSFSFRLLSHPNEPAQIFRKNGVSGKFVFENVPSAGFDKEKHHVGLTTLNFTVPKQTTLIFLMAFMFEPVLAINSIYDVEILDSILESFLELNGGDLVNYSTTFGRTFARFLSYRLICHKALEITSRDGELEKLTFKIDKDNILIALLERICTQAVYSPIVADLKKYKIEITQNGQNILVAYDDIEAAFEERPLFIKKNFFECLKKPSDVFDIFKFITYSREESLINDSYLSTNSMQVDENLLSFSKAMPNMSTNVIEPEVIKEIPKENMLITKLLVLNKLIGNLNQTYSVNKIGWNHSTMTFSPQILPKTGGVKIALSR